MSFVVASKESTRVPRKNTSLRVRKPNRSAQDILVTIVNNCGYPCNKILLQKLFYVFSFPPQVYLYHTNICITCSVRDCTAASHRTHSRYAVLSSRIFQAFSSSTQARGQHTEEWTTREPLEDIRWHQSLLSWALEEQVQGMRRPQPLAAWEEQVQLVHTGATMPFVRVGLAAVSPRHAARPRLA